jgi:hypothetical protein
MHNLGIEQRDGAAPGALQAAAVLEFLHPRLDQAQRERLMGVPVVAVGHEPGAQQVHAGHSGVLPVARGFGRHRSHAYRIPPPSSEISVAQPSSGAGCSALLGRRPVSQRKSKTASPALAPSSSHGSQAATENRPTTAGARTLDTVNAYWNAAR